MMILWFYQALTSPGANGFVYVHIRLQRTFQVHWNYCSLLSRLMQIVSLWWREMIQLVIPWFSASSISLVGVWSFKRYLHLTDNSLRSLYISIKKLIHKQGRKLSRLPPYALKKTVTRHYTYIFLARNV